MGPSLQGSSTMVHNPNRRTVVAGLGSVAAGFGLRPHGAEAQSMNTTPDLILFNGKITTLDRQNPQADAIAVHNGRFVAVGTERDVMALADPGTKRIDLKGRRVIPGLNDSHTH